MTSREINTMLFGLGLCVWALAAVVGLGYHPPPQDASAVRGLVMAMTLLGALIIAWATMPKIFLDGRHHR